MALPQFAVTMIMMSRRLEPPFERETIHTKVESMLRSFFRDYNIKSPNMSKLQLSNKLLINFCDFYILIANLLERCVALNSWA